MRTKNPEKLSIVLKKASRHTDAVGSGGTVPHIINLSSRWWVVIFTPRPLHPSEKRTLVPTG
jgi:hypothetical protein